MKGSTFQLIVSGLFIFFILAGVATFALFTSGGGSQAGAVSIWGTADKTLVETWLVAMRAVDKSFEKVSYTEVPASSYDSTLVNAMAGGSGPDLFLITDDKLVSFADKILLVPYDQYSQGTYTSSFVDEAGLFLTPQGIRAFPVFIDPLVMYWNRDTLAAAGVPNPPQYWSDLLALAPKITSLDVGQNIRKSAVAMGTWRNVVNAKPILATLMLQAGEPLVVRNEDGYLGVTLGSTQSGGESVAASALRFYTEFANPQKTTYSWSGAQQSSTNAFLAGDAALYFGFASEYAALRARNPNLRFDVALVPQLKSGTATTFGRITGAAIARGTQNPNGALLVAQKLSSRESVSGLATLSPLPPVRRDVQLDTTANAAAGVFVRSALISRGWYDPGPASDVIFKDMIESVISGKHEPSAAVLEAAQALGALVNGKQ